MSSNNSSQNSSEEIDLGRVFKLIGQAADGLFRGVLRLFVFLRKNFIWLALLIVVGFGLGFGLNKILPPKYALDVIVAPNLESKNHLLATVSEIKANLRSKDSAFLGKLGVEPDDYEVFSIEIEALDSPDKDQRNQDIKYLELLQDFDQSSDVSDIIRAELRNNTPLEYQLHFVFTDPQSGLEMARKTVAYINSNPFYGELTETVRENAQKRISYSDSLLVQADLLIENFNEKMLREDTEASARLVLDGEQDLNITELLELKRVLIRDMEAQKLQLSRIKAGVTVISFGTPHIASGSLWQRRTILFPALFVAGFLLLALIKYLNRKSQEYQMV